MREHAHCTSKAAADCHARHQGSNHRDSILLRPDHAAAAQSARGSHHGQRVQPGARHAGRRRRDPHVPGHVVCHHRRHCHTDHARHLCGGVSRRTAGANHQLHPGSLPLCQLPARAHSWHVAHDRRAVSDLQRTRQRAAGPGRQPRRRAIHAHGDHWCGQRHRQSLADRAAVLRDGANGVLVRRPCRRRTRTHGCAARRHALFGVVPVVFRGQHTAVVHPRRHVPPQHARLVPRGVCTVSSGGLDGLRQFRLRALHQAVHVQCTAALRVIVRAQRRLPCRAKLQVHRPAAAGRVWRAAVQHVRA